MTQKIMVLIVPLTKLGQNQCDDIKCNVAGSKPIWIEADTVLKASLLTIHA
jgi:hypothetical protein